MDRVTNFITPVLEGMGFELVEVAYLTERGHRLLRVTADRPEGGIGIEECARISREIGHLLDNEEILPNAYRLEVSSPGLNRPLKKEKDFLAAVGRRVQVTMGAPVGGRRRFTGRLEAVDPDTLRLSVDDTPVVLPLGDVEKANLVYEFPQ